MPQTERMSDHEIGVFFSKWAVKRREIGVRLFSVEGLPGAGKSCLLGRLSNAGFFANTDFTGIQLDDLLQKQAVSDISWLSQVEAAGAVQSIRTAMKKSGGVIVEGPMVWPVIAPIAEKIGRSKTGRVYLKRMSTGGSIIEWCDGDGLLEHAEVSKPYFQSIYEHHGLDKPWLAADLVIERVPQE